MNAVFKYFIAMFSMFVLALAVNYILYSYKPELYGKHNAVADSLAAVAKTDSMARADSLRVANETPQEIKQDSVEIPAEIPAPQTTIKQETQKVAQKPKEEFNAKEYAKLIEVMNPEEAAKVLTTMEQKKAKAILFVVKKKQAGKILSSMDPVYVAKLMR